MTEKYKLHCSFMVMPETFLMGNQAKIAIHPTLSIKDKKAPTKLMTNAKCIIKFQSYINPIATTKTLDNLVVSDTEDTIITFETTSDMYRIDIEFTAEVKKTLVNQKEIVTATHSIPIECHINDATFFDFYLRKAQNGYEVHALGKNGEPISGLPVEISYVTKYFHGSLYRKAILPKSGILQFNSLKHVGILRVSVNCQSISIVRSWLIPHEKLLYYPTQLDIIAGETIEIPYAIEETEEPNLFLELYNGKTAVANMSRFLIIEKSSQSKLYNSIKIGKLAAGEYRLWGAEGLDMLIKVHEGVLWNVDPSFIITRTALVEHHGIVNKPPLLDVNIVNENEIILHLDKGSRAHLFLFNFIPTHLDKAVYESIYGKVVLEKLYPFENWNTKYLSNRDMATEMRYTYDRKGMKRFTGNMLEKPTLLLKRQFLQSSETKPEESSTGTSFSSSVEQVSAARAEIKKIPRMAEASFGNILRSGYLPDNVDTVTGYQNFLQSPPVVFWNMIPNETGMVKAVLEPGVWQQYRSLVIVASREDTSSQLMKTIPGKQLLKRDLSLAHPLDSKKNFCEMRTTKCLSKAESYIFEDILSAGSDTKYIDTLDKVIQVLVALSGSPNKLKELGKFTELCHWHKKKMSEKASFFSQYYSHDLNLFIYKKDPEFFANVVKPFLMNKMEKTFIDYYLLQDYAKLKEIANRHSQVQRLNHLEKALLVEAIAESGDVATAQIMANRLSDSLHYYKKTTQEQQSIFGIVMSMNFVGMQDGNFFLC